MYNLKQNIERIIPLSKRLKQKKTYIPSSNIKKISVMKWTEYKDIPIIYGNKILKKGYTAITIFDIKNLLAQNPIIYKNAKGLEWIMIEDYPSPKEFIMQKSYSRAKFSFGVDKNKKKFAYITIRGNPYIWQIKKYGKIKAYSIYKYELEDELRHELIHYQQFKKGLIKPKNKSKYFYDEKLEKEALTKKLRKML